MRPAAALVPAPAGFPRDATRHRLRYPLGSTPCSIPAIHPISRGYPLNPERLHWSPAGRRLPAIEGRCCVSADQLGGYSSPSQTDAHLITPSWPATFSIDRDCTRSFDGRCRVFSSGIRSRSDTRSARSTIRRGVLAARIARKHPCRLLDPRYLQSTGETRCPAGGEQAAPSGNHRYFFQTPAAFPIRELPRTPHDRGASAWATPLLRANSPSTTPSRADFYVPSQAFFDAGHCLQQGRALGEPGRLSPCSTSPGRVTSMTWDGKRPIRRPGSRRSPTRGR